MINELMGHNGHYTISRNVGMGSQIKITVEYVIMTKRSGRIRGDFFLGEPSCYIKTIQFSLQGIYILLWGTTLFHEEMNQYFFFGESFNLIDYIGALFHK